MAFTHAPLDAGAEATMVHRRELLLVSPKAPPARLGADFLEQRRAASSAPGVGLLEPGKRGDVERHGSELRANLAEL